MQTSPAMPEQRPRKWLRHRFLLAGAHLLLALGALWLGMSIPSYFRSVSPLVLEAAAEGTPDLITQAAGHWQSGRTGLAQSLLAAAEPDGEDRDAVEDGLANLLEEQPLYHWSGGPAPFYEAFLRQASSLRLDEPAVIPSLLPGQHRDTLLGFLSESPNRNVQLILRARGLDTWQRFYPVFSTSGQPLDATLLTTALLEQSGAFRESVQAALMEAVRGALAGQNPEAERLELFCLAVLTLGRHSNWLQLETLISRCETEDALLKAAQAIQEDPARQPLLLSALLNVRDSSILFDYLSLHQDSGWKGLAFALQQGRGAVEALLEFNKPVYRPPAFWERLPNVISASQPSFKRLAEATPMAALGLRILCFGLVGVGLVGLLRSAILGRILRPGPQRRFLINLDSLVGAILASLLVWILIEPGLLEFHPNEAGRLEIRLAEILPAEAGSAAGETVTAMIDQVTILVLLFFFTLQLLVFIFCLLKIAEIRRHAATPPVKLRLLDNEENLFDLGLYVGLGGTVASLILVVLNIVDASLMAAYASTLFGIIFVAVLKIGFLRPLRRRLILENS